MRSALAVLIETGKGLFRRLDDILGVLLAAFAIVSLLALLGLSAGAWTVVLADTLTVWLGQGVWLIPTSTAGIAALLLSRALGKPLEVNWWRVLAAEIGAVCALGLGHLWMATDYGRTQGLSLTDALATNAVLLRAAAGAGGGVVGWAVASLADQLVQGLAGGLLLLLFVGAFIYASGVRLTHILDAGIALQYWLRERMQSDVIVETGRGLAVTKSPVARSKPDAAPRHKPKRVRYEKRFTVAPVQDDRPARPRKRPPLLPDLALLGVGETILPSEKDINRNAAIIESTLADFGVSATVIDFQTGPSVTQFAVEPGFIERPGADGAMRRHKVRVSQISNLANDLALALAASPIRIEAPVPGKSYVGIEVPNRKKFLVGLRGVIESQAFQRINAPLAIALGRNVAGASVAANLGLMPHLLIAGTTGSGKSVCITSIITCLVANNSPDDLRLVMIDPKKVELLRFNGLPHLYGRVEVELDRIIGTLRWVMREMDRRYKLFEEMQARDLDVYNRKIGRRKTVERLPRIVVLVDELADLMMMAHDETEKTLARLAQMARATGIHLVVATQRPSTDVVTGLIKANFPARISFAVASMVDSRVILDEPGAETLLGQGDMLFLAPDAAGPSRLQGTFVGDKEVEDIVEYWREQWAEYESAEADEETVVQPPRAPWDEMLAREAVVENRDDQIVQAIDIVKKHRQASASLLQRKMRIGYPRAARLMDELQEMGIIGRARHGGKTREVLIGADDDPIGSAAQIIGGDE
ncbi:MAG: DNA translocase FtsK [Anaerolineales bacterium]